MAEMKLDFWLHGGDLDIETLKAVHYEKIMTPSMRIQACFQNYTSFQRQELVNFATFLFDEQFYERALLVFFQFLYKYPGDELEIAAYFNIAKCYEMMGNWDLAEN